MISKTIPEAIWDENTTPIIYLPGIAKSDFRNVEVAGLDLQPLLEYQYTGTMFLQENGKEWTILAFVENTTAGLGLNIVKDSGTKSQSGFDPSFKPHKKSTYKFLRKCLGIISRGD